MNDYGLANCRKGRASPHHIQPIYSALAIYRAVIYRALAICNFFLILTALYIAGALYLRKIPFFLPVFMCKHEYGIFPVYRGLICLQCRPRVIMENQVSCTGRIQRRSKQQRLCVSSSEGADVEVTGYLFKVTGHMRR